MTRILTILSIMARCLGIVSVAQAQEGVAPHPPVNVQASATDERVTSTCQGNVSDSQVTGYRIECYEGHRSGWNTLVTFLPAANQYPRNNPDVIETYVDTGVLPSAPSRYRIRSVSDRGTSSGYEGVKVVSAVDPPGRRIFMDTGRVTIGWDAPEDDSVTGYRILRRVQSGPEKTLVGDTGPGVTGWVDRQVFPRQRLRLPAPGPARRTSGREIALPLRADAAGRNPDGRCLRAGRAGPVLWSRRLRADPTTNAKESLS